MIDINLSRIFKYCIKSPKSRSRLLVSIKLLSLVLGPLFIGSLIPILDSAFAQGAEDLVNRRIEIWNEFYRLMIVALVVGTIVQGFIIYIVFKFKEKTVKQKEVPSQQ